MDQFERIDPSPRSKDMFDTYSQSLNATGSNISIARESTLDSLQTSQHSHRQKHIRNTSSTQSIELHVRETLACRRLSSAFSIVCLTVRKVAFPPKCIIGQELPTVDGTPSSRSNPFCTEI